MTNSTAEDFGVRNNQCNIISIEICICISIGRYTIVLITIYIVTVLTGHDGVPIVHLHICFGQTNRSNKWIVNRWSIQPHYGDVIGVRGMIVVWMYSNICYPVVDVLCLVISGEIIFTKSDYNIFFIVSEKYWSTVKYDDAVATTY